MDDEVHYLKTKVTKWCDAVRSKRLLRSEAWYCLNSTIMKTIEYPLMATTISKRDMDEIMKPILATALPISGVQQRIPKKLLYGTLRSQGLNIQDPYTTQLIEHLLSILRHCHRYTPSSELHAENMELVQCHVGSKTPFWELPYPLYGCLAPEGWMQFTWETLSATNITIRGPLPTIPLSRLHDIHLMDAFIHHTHDTSILQELNDCRMFLQATTLSHISTADGHNIQHHAWYGTEPSLVQTPPSWPKTYRPNANAWITWQQYLRQAFLFPHATHKQLRQPLGHWTTTRDTTWPWWHHLHNDTLYERLPQDTWRIWTRDTAYSRSPRYTSTNTTIIDLPSDCRRISTTHNATDAWQTILCQAPPNPPPPMPPPNANTLSSGLQTLPHEAQWALQHIIQTNEGTTIAAALRDGSAIAVSDGSLKLNRGTAAATIEGPTPNHRIRCYTRVPGYVDDGDSHRCELSGIYMIIIICNTLCRVYHITRGDILLACDNQQALKLFESDHIPDPADKNFDLSNAIWKLLQDSPLTWTAEHVYGHQDTRNTTQRPLTRLELMNIEMDKAAKAFWHHTFLHADPNLPLADTPHTQIYQEASELPTLRMS